VKYSAKNVAPATPPAIVMASGGQKPPPPRINRKNPTIVVRHAALGQTEHQYAVEIKRAQPEAASDSCKGEAQKDNKNGE